MLSDECNVEEFNINKPQKLSLVLNNKSSVWPEAEGLQIFFLFLVAEAEAGAEGGRLFWEDEGLEEGPGTGVELNSKIGQIKNTVIETLVKAGEHPNDKMLKNPNEVLFPFSSPKLI